MSTTVPIISVVIPARDEAGNLPALLAEVNAALKTIPHEVIVVDDGSSDTSWAWLCEHAQAHQQLRALHHDQSVGQSTAIWNGARLARGIWLATLDADGQNDPADLPKLLEYARADEVALIAGQRMSRHDDWLKRLSSRVANTVRSRILGDRTPDTGCGLKLIHREAFLALPYFDHMHRFLPALIQAQGGRCISVPVNHRPRHAGASHYGLHDRLWAGLVDIIGVKWLQARTRLPVTFETTPLAVGEDEPSATLQKTGND